MSEALVGVVIGGAIASIAPVTTLFVEHRRWKMKVKLEHLKNKRSQLERLFATN